MQRFSSRLAYLMNEKGISQQALAQVIGVARQSIAQYLDGKTQPNAEKICAIADYFGVSTDYLLGRVDLQSTDIDIQGICKKTNISQKALEVILNEKFQRFDDRQFCCIDTLNILLENFHFQKAIIAASECLNLSTISWEESAEGIQNKNGEFLVYLTGKFAADFYKKRFLDSMDDSLFELMMEVGEKHDEA